MARRSYRGVLLAILVAVFLSAQPVLAQLRMIDLGTFGGTSSPEIGQVGFVEVIKINNLGQVVGTLKNVSGQWQYHAFLWTAAGGMIDLGTLGNGDYSEAKDINELGQIIGTSTTIAGDPFQDQALWDSAHAVLWTTAGGMIDLGTLGGSFSYAGAINNSGQVVGDSLTAAGEDHAFLWTAKGGMVDLGTLGGSFSYAGAINNQGQVVGYSQTASGEDHAFLWTAKGGMVDLGTLGGSFSYAEAINNRGQVVGDAETASGEDHAFLWTAKGRMVDLGTLGGSFSYAEAINNQRQVAGVAETASGEYHAFLWTAAGGMIDLGTLGNGTYSEAGAINDLGQVVGFSTTQPGDPGQDVTLWDTAHAFLWTAAGGMVDLGTLGGTWSHALAINKVGQIAGFSTTASSEEHAVLWELALPALSSFSIFATNSVWLSHGAQVNSGNIGVQDKNSGPWCAAKAEVMIGNRAYLKDKVAIYGDSVMIFPGASVYDVYYNELRNKGSIRGDKYTPLELPLGVALPEFPTLHPGTKNYVAPTGKVLILEPGSYGTVKVESRATLILTGGTYHVEDLIVGSIHSKVLFRGPTELIIKDCLRSGVDAFIGPEKGADISAKDIRIYVAGTHCKTGKCGATHKAAVIGEHNTVMANIYVPDGTLWINQGNVVTGALIAKDVVIGEDVQVTLDSAF